MPIGGKCADSRILHVGSESGPIIHWPGRLHCCPFALLQQNCWSSGRLLFHFSWGVMSRHQLIQTRQWLSFHPSLARRSNDLIGDTGSIGEHVTVSEAGPKMPAQEFCIIGGPGNLHAASPEWSSHELFTAYITLGCESCHFLRLLSGGGWVSFLRLVSFHSSLRFMILFLLSRSEHFNMEEIDRHH